MILVTKTFNFVYSGGQFIGIEPILEYWLIMGRMLERIPKYTRE